MSISPSPRTRKKTYANSGQPNTLQKRPLLKVDIFPDARLTDEHQSTVSSIRANAGSPLVASARTALNGLFQYAWVDPSQNDWSVRTAIVPDKEPARVLRSDPDLKKLLTNVVAKKLPKYLFRMWHPNSAGGIHQHSTIGITPSGFRNGNKGHKSVFDMSLEVFRIMVDRHVLFDNQQGSEFTSWSPSIHFCLAYASTKAETAYIAVIDTEKIAKTNATLWVANLKGGLYPEEYLVHGPIRDRRSRKERIAKPFDLPYIAVPFRTLRARGLTRRFDVYRTKLQPWPDPGLLPDQTIRKISLAEVRQLRHIAAPFGKPFAVVITISLICLVRRSEHYWADITTSEIDTVLCGLGKSTFNWLNWSGSAGVLDNAYDLRFEDNRQMTNLMRGLYERTWGKKARAQRRKWSVDGSLLTPTTPGRW